MIVPDPPAAVRCAACLSAVDHVYHPRHGWVGLVVDGNRLLRVHDCRPRRATPPTADYLAARDKIRTEGDTQP